MSTFHTLLVILLATIGTNAFTWDERTPLDDYVQLDDGYFSFTELLSYRFEENATTVYMLNMTSQKWMDETFTTRSIWWHMMAIAIPDTIRHQVSYLWIEGGSNGDGTQPNPPDDPYVMMLVEITARAGCIAAYVLQVPNESMVFSNDPSQSSKTEDAIIAWTWHTFMTTHMDQPEVILRMPMTKAAKRAMDTVQQVVAAKVPGTDINRFIPGGGSKRGWTTWSVAATDPRVIAATPCVMSLLNFNTTLQAHYRNLGGAWTFVFSDYYAVNLTMKMHDDIVIKSPGGLWDYEDMFRYKERLGLIPKLLVSAAGDEFFMLTDSHSWWNEMPGVKYIMMVPNAEHSLVPWYRKVGESIASFVICLLENIKMPSISWTRSETSTGGRVTFFTDTKPDNLSVWQAFTWKNDTRKDFRLAVGYPPYIHPVLWHRIPYVDLDNGNYEIDFDRPDVGFGGVFFEAVWNYVSDIRLTLTTEVHVSPDIFPAPPCYGVECYGYLI
jgi:PhoPQ-activated pathogenicity-related protein